MNERKLRDRGSRIVHELHTAIRRMLVAATDGVAWVLDGFIDFDGNVEQEQAEVFTAGSWYRPADDSGAEAMLVLVGAQSDNPAIIAIRDERARAAIADAIAMAKGEHIVYSPAGSVVYMKSDGTVEVRSKDGTARRLMTVDDGAALKQAITDAVTVANDGGASFKADLLTGLVDWPTGTSKLKGE